VPEHFDGAERTGPVRIVVVYPGLMGTYGDGGNAVALRARCTRRGIDASIVAVHAPDPVPRDADLYLLGGSENASQAMASTLLRTEGGLRAAVGNGATIVGICGGYQILGESVTDADGVVVEGLGLLDVRSGPLATRAVGDIAVRVAAPDGGAPHVLVGFENHAFGTVLGPAATALGSVERGVGNGLPSTHERARTEGAVQGRVLGTYLHGPLLAVNPALADHLLAPIVGPLADLDDSIADEVRELRLALPAARRRGRGRVR